MSRVMGKLAMYQMRDVSRSRWVYAYTFFFLLSGEGLLRFTGADSRGLLGLANVVLLVVPLVSVTFATMYVYSSREFIELMLAQPVTRAELFIGVLTGLAVPMCAAILIGLGIPLLLHGSADGEFVGRSVVLLGIGVALTAVMSVLAVWIAFRIRDRLKGLAVAISLWLVLSVVYDGVLLLIITGYSDYPLEGVMLTLTLLNPVDLARVLLLLQFDVSALMSYTGALFSQFVSGTVGIAAIAGALLVWTMVPAWMGLRAFRKRDF